MSTNLPPDRPTEPLRPLQPTPPPVVEERVVTPVADSSFVLARLEDAVASLRTWLAVVALLSLVALGVGIYALTRQNDNSSGGSRSGLATDKRVSRVNDRVDRLSRQMQSLRASRAAAGSAGSSADTDTAALSDRIDALESTVKTLAGRSAPDATQAVKELSGRIDKIAQDVEQLKQDQAAAP
jgi:hypothetical protein